MRTAVAERSPVQQDHMIAVRAGVGIEMVTVVWMTIEAVVAIGAGLGSRERAQRPCARCPAPARQPSCG